MIRCFVWFDVLTKTCERSYAWAGTLLWWSCQSPVAYSWGLSNNPNNFHGGMFKLNANFYADLLLYSLSYIDCDCHTVHVLTQWCLPPPLTSTVKSSLFTHAHSSPLSLAVRLHRCSTNCSHYINNGWTFSEQTIIYIYIYKYVEIYVNIYLYTFIYSYIIYWVYWEYIVLKVMCMCVYTYTHTHTYIYIHNYYMSKFRLSLSQKLSL